MAGLASSGRAAAGGDDTRGGQREGRQRGRRGELDLGHQHLPQKWPGSKAATPAEAEPPVAASTVDRRATAEPPPSLPWPPAAAPTAGAAKPPARQPAFEPLPRLGQPATERGHGPAEPIGRLVVGQPFEVAKHDRQALAFGQAIDLCVQQSARTSWSDSDSGSDVMSSRGPSPMPPPLSVAVSSPRR